MFDILNRRPVCKTAADATATSTDAAPVRAIRVLVVRRNEQVSEQEQLRAEMKTRAMVHGRGQNYVRDSAPIQVQRGVPVHLTERHTSMTSGAIGSTESRRLLLARHGRKDVEEPLVELATTAHT